MLRAIHRPRVSGYALPLWGVFAVLAVCGCGGGSGAAAPAGDAKASGSAVNDRELLMKAPVTLSLEIVGRFVSGRAWKLGVEPDGTAMLHISTLSKPTEHKFTVSAKQLDELRELLIDQEFFDLGGEYGERVPDGSTRTMTVTLGELKTTVTLVFLHNWLREDSSKVVEPARALRVWALVRGWFKDDQAVDLRKYDQRIIDAADAVDGSGGIQ